MDLKWTRNFNVVAVVKARPLGGKKLLEKKKKKKQNIKITKTKRSVKLHFKMQGFT